MSYSANSLLIFYPIFWILSSIPAYVVGDRTGVTLPGVAFIPAVGAYIVLLQSIKRSGWLCLLVLIPFVNLVFLIWLAFAIPSGHRRTPMWALAFLVPVVDLIAFYAYAFTLDPFGGSGRSGQRPDELGSTYHVPPAGDWRP